MAAAQAFDPAAETARYLATLSPEVHEKATAYTQGGHWLLLWGTLVAVVVAWLVIRSGLLVKIRAGVERSRPRPWLAALAVLPVALALEELLSLPWSIYADWFREKSYGLTSQPLGGWLGEWAVGAGFGLVVSVLVLAIIYWLLRRAPKTWWLWAGGVSTVTLVLVLVLAPIFLLPLFNSYTPAPDGPVRDAIVEMARANGIPSEKIFVYDGSKQSNRYTANVTGLFGSAQINMSDTMFKAGADMAEIRAVVGHEMGHYARGHILSRVAATALLLVIGFWAVDRLFPQAARVLGARDVKGIADPAGLPVLMAVLSVLGLLATPAFNAITRLAEADADNYSLQIAGEPDGLAKALIQTVEYRAATPGALEEALFYSHPSVSWRIRNAMDWKAANLERAPVLIDMTPDSLPTTQAPPPAEPAPPATAAGRPQQGG
jgi:STE24 endopeptidase